MEEEESSSWLVKQGLDEEPEKRFKGSRISVLQMKIKKLNDPEDIMLEIMDTFTETEIVPDVGNYYTYIFNAKTPNIRYDQHPLVAVLEIFNWGFRGINFHWREVRQYTWDEVSGELHLVYPNEIKDLQSIPYQKIQIS